jgi:hypothetical protein
MKWLLSAYSQGWNRAHMRRGHVFQGRYKAVPVNASDSAGDGASWFSKPIRLGRQSGQYDAEIDQKYRKNVNPCTLTPLNGLILDKAGKRPDDGYWGSHPGVALAGDRAFIFYHVHAGRKIGVDTAALDQKGIEFKRTSLQVAEIELKDGKISCDRDNHPTSHTNR